MIKKVISFGICLSCLYVTALPVIIIDTGDWDGAVRATTHGFITYSGGTWVQVGANGGTQSIGWPPALWYTYRPAIRFTGVNTVTCNFNDIGWISASSGISAADEIEFETQNLVITNPVPVPTLQQRDMLINFVEIVGSSTWNTFPEDGKFDYYGEVRSSLNSEQLLGISEVMSWMVTGSAPISAVPAIGVYVTLATVVLDAASRYVDHMSSISQIIYDCKNTESSPLPGSHQTWRLLGETTADLYHITNIKIYNDDNHDGFVPNGETLNVTIPFYRNIKHRVYVELNPPF